VKTRYDIIDYNFSIPYEVPELAGGGDFSMQQTGYYDELGVYHQHSKADFCLHHPTDVKCMPQQVQMPIQAQVAMPVHQKFYKEHIEEKFDFSKEVVLWVGDHIGYGTVLLVIGVGALAVFKKRIKKWIKDQYQYGRNTLKN